jgi:hypothetical protein
VDHASGWLLSSFALMLQTVNLTITNRVWLCYGEMSLKADGYLTHEADEAAMNDGQDLALRVRRRAISSPCIVANTLDSKADRRDLEKR